VTAKVLAIADYNSRRTTSPGLPLTFERFKDSLRQSVDAMKADRSVSQCQVGPFPGEPADL
jgi:hypothetical protein